MQHAPSIEYLQAACGDGRDGQFSRDPWFQVYYQSPTDTSLAPEGHHTMSFFVQYASYHLAGGTWDDIRSQATDRVLELAEESMPGVTDRVVDRVVLAPPAIEARTGLTFADIHHTHMSPDQLFDKRNPTGMPGHATPIQGLYLCGAGTHPGGEVTGAPGYNAAHEVIRALAQ